MADPTLTNLSSLAATTTQAAALSSLVLATPQSTIGYQPQYPGSTDLTLALPKALLFHYEGEQSVTIESDITDHYVEDNTAIQDQIALRPEVVQTKGYIGELNNVPPLPLQILKTIVDKLSTIVAYTPALTTAAEVAYNQAFAAYQATASAVNSAISAWSSVAALSQPGVDQGVIGANGLTEGLNQNRQQAMFQQFYGYWRARTLFTVQTPWAVFQNMAIQRLHPVQDEDTRVISTFEVTFKMIRDASTSFLPPPVRVSRAATQSAPLEDQGTSKPTASIPLSEGIAQIGAVA